MADLHGAGLRTLGFANVPNAGAGDRDHPHMARFAVVRRNRRGALEGLMIRVGAGWPLEDDVAVRQPTHVASLVFRHLDAQRIVVVVGPTSHHRPSTRQEGEESADGGPIGR